MDKEKIKVIIDTDPGVDDITALSFAFVEERLDIKLLTISYGNLDVYTETRNACHLLDIFNKDIPLVTGYPKRYSDSLENAIFLHGRDGTGKYIPPKETIRKPIKKDVADAMYEVLLENPHEITMVILGPHTNFARLLIRHPDAKDLIKDVLMMGASPNGIKVDPNHKSFNIRTDPNAFKYTVDAKLPITLCPSRIGRDTTHFTFKQVNQISKMNDVGKMLSLTYQTYWEPHYKDKRIANCDLSTIYYLLYPEIYKTENATIDVDVDKNPGKVTAKFDKNGNAKFIMKVNRKKFMKIVFNQIHKFDGITIENLKRQ